MALLPKNSSFSSDLNRFQPGSIVMYENDNSALLACILDFRKGKYVLLNNRGREIELPANRLYSFQSLMPSGAATRDAKATYLEDLLSKGKALTSEVNLEDLWNDLSGQERDFNCRELAGNYLGEFSLEQHIAFRLALIEDSVFFKRKNDSFLPRPPAVVAQLKESEAERKRKQALEEEAYSEFHEKIKNPAKQLSEKFNPLLKTMAEIAAESKNVDPSRLREVRDFIHNFSERFGIQIPGSNNERVYNFLRLINYFTPFTNLSLIRNGLEISHSPEAVKLAREINSKTDSGSGRRRDLTALDCFTIDDISTRDMDDAISLEVTHDGYLLGLHISDVASSIPKDHPLDRFLTRRPSSLYLPDMIVNMLPEELSQDMVSLVPGQTRPALSFLLNINRDFEVRSCEIVPSNVFVKRKLSYEEANLLLEDPHEKIFEILHNIAATHEMQRIENGAIQLHKKEAYVQIKGENELGLQEIDENAPSRRLVSELMIIANSELARFANERSIPLIYRTQEKPERQPGETQSGQRSQESPSGDLASRMSLKKSLNLTAALPHAGLGLEYYCQATSPIRRYLDLCNQRQIISFLNSGTPAYQRNELNKILEQIDQDLQRYAVINKESKRFWLLKYLELHVFRQRTIKGTVVRTDLKTPLVELEDVFLTVGVRLPEKQKPGVSLNFKIVNINPAFDYLKLEVAG